MDADLIGDYSSDDGIEVVNVENLQRNFHEDEIRTFDMTSLGALMLLGHTTSKYSENKSTVIDEDTNLRRLSLAYERLRTFPKIILDEWGPQVQILDISHNEFSNLDFLCDFKELTSLICDHNPITAKTRMPFLPQLELLWMNHCRISELYPWIRMLQYSCPNLRFLSLMGNPISPYYIWSDDITEGIHYRYFLMSLFPNLVHLDGRIVTATDKENAQKFYQRPVVERIVSRTQRTLPDHLRVVAERVSDFFTPPPDFFNPHTKKNSVI